MKHLSTKLLGLAIFIALIFSCKKEAPVEPIIPNRNPTAAQLSLPANGTSNQALLPVLTWQASSDPDNDPVSYDVFLDTNSDPQTRIAAGLNNNNFTLTHSLMSGIRYYWKVISNDGNGGSAISSVFSFSSKENIPPRYFNLLSPENGEEFIDLNPILSWETALDADGDAVVYDLYFGKDNVPSTPYAAGLSETSYTITEPLLAEELYRWKVIARDGNGGSYESNPFFFTARPLIGATKLPDAPWSARSGHRTLVYEGKIWVMGGSGCCGGALNDVWNSTDGENWTLVTEAADFPIRKSFGALVFDNKMWVIGGVGQSYIAGSDYNDVWFSTDGANWTLATDNAAFPPKHGMESEVYDGKMWIFGGSTIGQEISKKQAWYSTDGVEWALAIDDTNFGGEINFEITEFNGKLWKTGGWTNLVYSSTDGINWELEAEDLGMGERYTHACAVFDDKLWLIGGADRLISLLNEIPDVWFTEDGINWQLAAADGGFRAMVTHDAIVFNGKIMLVGGGAGWQSGDVWNEVYALDYL